MWIEFVPVFTGAAQFQRNWFRAQCLFTFSSGRTRFLGMCVICFGHSNLSRFFIWSTYCYYSISFSWPEQPIHFPIDGRKKIWVFCISDPTKSFAIPKHLRLAMNLENYSPSFRNTYNFHFISFHFVSQINSFLHCKPLAIRFHEKWNGKKVFRFKFCKKLNAMRNGIGEVDNIWFILHKFCSERDERKKMCAYSQGIMLMWRWPVTVMANDTERWLLGGTR